MKLIITILKYLCLMCMVLLGYALGVGFFTIFGIPFTPIYAIIFAISILIFGYVVQIVRIG